MKPIKVVLPHWAIFIIDTGIIFGSIVLSYLLRFNFSIPITEIDAIPTIILFIISIRMIIFAINRTYLGIIRYINFIDILKSYYLIIIGSLIFLLSDIIFYYFVNQTLFIPLTIIIIEFLLTSFFIITFRSIIKISYSYSLGKEYLRRLIRKMKK